MVTQNTPPSGGIRTREKRIVTPQDLSGKILISHTHPANSVCPASQPADRVSSRQTVNISVEFRANSGVTRYNHNHIVATKCRTSLYEPERRKGRRSLSLDLRFSTITVEREALESLGVLFLIMQQWDVVRPLVQSILSSHRVFFLSFAHLYRNFPFYFSLFSFGATAEWCGVVFFSLLLSEFG